MSKSFKCKRNLEDNPFTIFRVQWRQPHKLYYNTCLRKVLFGIFYQQMVIFRHYLLIKIAAKVSKFKIPQTENFTCLYQHSSTTSTNPVKYWYIPNLIEHSNPQWFIVSFNKTQKNWVQDCSKMLLRLSTNMSRHVQTCHNIMIRFDTILQTCPDLSWYNSANMSKHAQTCLWYNLIQFYMSQTCLNLS